jgi:hypothetical protein
MTAIDGEPTLVHRTQGEQCTHCGSPLAADQRYCLNCGTRRAERRVPVAATRASSPAPEGVAPPLAPAGGPPAVERLGGAWGVAALLLLALGVGVIIGNQSGDDAPVAAQPPAVTIAGGALGPTAPATPVASTTPAADEWPDRDGFTVQLGELPKAGTDQAAADAAKAAASAKGATAPGVLDAGAHGLTDGQLVLYSGVFSTRKQATTALDGLKAAYPDARVIKVKATSSAAGATGGGAAGAAAPSTSSKPETVSKSKLKETERLDPEAFQKQSKKLPKTTVLPGKAPPKDNAAPGGGSDAETIG